MDNTYDKKMIIKEFILKYFQLLEIINICDIVLINNKIDNFILLSREIFLYSILLFNIIMDMILKYYYK